MKFTDFWYIVAPSDRLQPDRVLSCTVLDEWLAIFRDAKGQPVAVRDRCAHRNSRLSAGKVCQGQLHCPYHGWVYDNLGKVVAIPAEGENWQNATDRRTPRYDTCERDGYVYVRLTEPASSPTAEFDPFPMPYYGAPQWATVRVINRFNNNVTNCAENFIDIPHTAFVHPGIFRTTRHQQIAMTVSRRQGTVFVEYANENTNLGWYARFLNPSGDRIHHTDSFHMPNITSVEYNLGRDRRIFITSQSVPESSTSTLVYTDVTYNYGIWNHIARPFIHWTAQYIIHQDIKILGIQQAAIAKYGQQFSHTPADTIHIFVESIRTEIANSKDPRLLPDRSVKVDFWV
ncbi:aromatic ring-hydroxylating dioxygenase subunit alpha [Chamaesiphon sp. VAR_48_metabat_403]|uniref:aromatic ring-hydroxylating dioxygenase subunit alpha n=1 Tax=Chamaesiphon sp. VAR_48_metabat_403 TaxID=2964700 RepID=UPI00286E8B26|nr:aromatic ring-hydroxylating dioxygenase subunit alpha [Chamaesiphon sp. VAR_48_metabat_403]